MAAMQSLDDERKLRPTWSLIGIGALEVLSYSFTKYSSSAVGSVALWVALSAFLFWRIWRNSFRAWLALVALNAGVAVLVILALFDVIQTGQSGLWLFWRALIVVAEILLLASSRVRRWIDL